MRDDADKAPPTAVSALHNKPTERGTAGSMNRRTLLATLGAVSTTGLFAGCGEAGPAPAPDPTDSPEPGFVEGPADEPDQLEAIATEWGFDRIVDLEAAGADSTGSSPVDDSFEEELQDGTLLFLPPGRYRIEDSIAADAVPNVGIVGPDATIVPAEGFDSTILGLGWPDPGGELLVSGLEFDYTADDTGGRPILARARDRVDVRDVSVTGVADVEQDLVRIDVTGDDGVGTIERLQLPDGADPDLHVTGCEVGDDNRGDLSFIDCHIEGFTDNGLYADPPQGSVEVRGGTYRNNGVASVRVDSPDETLVSGVHVVCDTDVGGENMRGIRLRGGSQVTVEDCRVELREVTYSDGAIAFASELGAATVRNCRIRVDADDVNAIRIKSPSTDRTSRGPFRCENVVITGSASEGAAVDAANREGCLFNRVCIHQTGDNRGGFVFDNVEGEVVDSFVSVTGRPLTIQRSDVRQQDVTIDRSPETVTDSSFRSCR